MRGANLTEKLIAHPPIRLKLPFLPTMKVLELGGNIEHPTFRPNLNIRQGPGVDIVADLHNGIPLPDEDCDGIFSHHVLEHIKPESMAFILRECYRVLKPRGICACIVPNVVAAATTILNEKNWSPEFIAGLNQQVYGGGIDYGLPDYAGNYHRQGFTPWTLGRMLEAVFDEVLVTTHPDPKAHMDMLALAGKA